jgi:thiamine pyrophosphokinase
MKKRIAIIAGGASLTSSLADDLKGRSNFIICANGGYQNAIDAGIVPDLIVGDLDSVDPEKIEAAKDAGITLRVFPTKKNESDLELALEEALKMNPEVIHIAGAMGKRFDHTLFNIMLLFRYRNSGFPLTIMGNEEEIFIASRKTTLHNRENHVVSLVPFTAEVTGVKLEGFLYPLHRETLYMGSTRGLSNQVTKSLSTIEYDEGILLVIINR